MITIPKFFFLAFLLLTVSVIGLVAILALSRNGGMPTPEWQFFMGSHGFSIIEHDTIDTI